LIVLLLRRLALNARRIVSGTPRASKQLSAERRDFSQVALLALLASNDLTNGSANDDLKW
jgi:hypothetical protein